MSATLGAVATEKLRGTYACPTPNRRPVYGPSLGRGLGADGARLRKIESDPITLAQDVTLYMGPVEIRHWGTG
ncbi:MAG: hypothetical protein KDE03_14435 [Rhodobacteraceae bacterium]|nr:hypothetical protein [Paracoccaceae bacterium]